MKAFNRLVGRFTSLPLPLTYVWMIKRWLAGASSILDVGCRDGSLISLTKPGKSLTVGLDIYKPYLEEEKR